MNASEDKVDKGTTKDSWLARINLLLTMTLAALGFWLNYTTQQQKQAFEAQKLAIGLIPNLNNFPFFFPSKVFLLFKSIS